MLLCLGWWLWCDGSQTSNGYDALSTITGDLHKNLCLKTPAYSYPDLMVKNSLILKENSWDS